MADKTFDAGDESNSSEARQLPEDELATIVGERYAKALVLRRQGMTYAAIGNELGVGSSRARMMVKLAEQRLKEPKKRDELSGLSTRTRNTLLGEGYKTKAQILEGVKSGKIHPKSTGLGKIPNYGKKAHREVCEWLGIEYEDVDDAPNQTTIKRYIKYLERHGYKVIEPK